MDNHNVFDEVINQTAQGFFASPFQTYGTLLLNKFNGVNNLLFSCFRRGDVLMISSYPYATWPGKSN